VVAGRAVGELEDAHVGVALRAQGLRACARPWPLQDVVSLRGFIAQ